MSWYGRILTVAMLTVLASPATAATPTTALVDGVLTSSGGSAAADGDYNVVFAIYDAATGGVAAWTESGKLTVVGGRFSYALGANTPVDTAKLLALSGQWLSLKVGADPELPRQKLHTTIFSMVAGEALKLSCDGCVGGTQLSNGSVAAAKVGFNFAASSTKGGPAIDVECTGCVNVADIKFDGDVDLAGNSLKAKNGTFSGDVVAATVTATSFAGDGSKLTGIKTPSGECKVAGEVVKGINADGSLKCVAALDPSALPKDGLNEISNDLISNQFVDTVQGAAGVKIPDNTGSDANSTLDFPDIGTSQTFELSVDVANTDLSKVSITVLPPDDKKTGWTLCDPCGKADEKSYKVTFSKDNLPKSGDLAKWIGANPKGTWNLKVLDAGYCVPQAPGNAALCDTTAKTDGSILTWNIKIQTLSNQKIAINGSVGISGQVIGDLSLSGGVKLGDTNAVCDAKTEGMLRNSAASGQVEICQNSTWVQMSRDLCWGSMTHGICFASVGAGNPNFLDGSKYCAGKKADVCSDSQVWVLRQTAALWSNAIWTNSYSDNDSNYWNELNGGTGDNHGNGSGWTTPCCFNVTPPRATDKIIKGVRVVYQNEHPSVYFRQAAMFCAGMQADLCTKSEYQVLRDNGVTNKSWGYWSSDHSDNDNTGYEKGIGPVTDDPSLGNHYGFICCASHRKTLDCPAPAKEYGGLCVTKVVNSTADWPTAAADCSSLNSRLCSISQTAVLRNLGVVTSAASWTASYSDNDGSQAAVGVGNAGDDHPPSSQYGYACCAW